MRLDRITLDLPTLEVQTSNLMRITSQDLLLHPRYLPYQNPLPLLGPPMQQRKSQSMSQLLPLLRADTVLFSIQPQPEELQPLPEEPQPMPEEPQSKIR